MNKLISAGFAARLQFQRMNMMKKYIALLLAIPALILAGCQPSVEKAEANYCKDLASLKQSLAELAAISPSSKVGDVKKAQENVEKSLADFRKSVSQVKEAKTDALDAANADLDKTIKAIPNRDTLAEAAATIKPKVEVVEVARAQLQTQVNCP
jgi:ribosomal protein S18